MSRAVRIGRVGAFFALIGFGISVQFCVAGVNVFIGPSGGDWFDPANWSEGVVPGAQSDVELPVIASIGDVGAACALLRAFGDGGYDVLSGADLTSGSQIISSTAALEPGEVALVKQFGGTIDITGNLAIGHGGHGTFTQLGGSLSAEVIAVGATVDDGQQVFDSVGLFEVHDGATLIATELRIGMLDENEGVFRQFGGEVVINGPIGVGLLNCCVVIPESRQLAALGGTLFSESAVIGREPVGFGSALVDGGDWTIANLLVVGERDSIGELLIQGGGIVATNAATFGGQDAGGNLTVSGAGSQLTSAQDFAAAACLGSSTIMVLDGGGVSTGPASLGIPCGSLPGFARVTITGENSIWSVSGNAEMRGGVFSSAPPSSLTVNDGGRFVADEFKLMLDPVPPGAMLRGDGGTVEASFINMSRVMPGQDAETSFGVLQIDGDYVQTGTFITHFPDPDTTVTAFGELQIEIGGDTPGEEFDRLDITGVFKGRGVLSATLENGFDPPLGSIFEIVRYGGFEAPFDETSLPTFPDARVMVVEYVPDTGPETPGVVRLRVTSTCPADFDGDGDVDETDVVELILDWGQCAGCAADVNGNGTVDVDDLLAMVHSWGSCAEPN